MSDVIDCPFCNPQERVLKENGYAQMLLSDPRKVPGHMLVMPKRHMVKPWELTEKELTDIFELIFFVQQRVIGVLGEGCDIRQNYRPFSNQNSLKVNHLTFHVVPRSQNDYLYQVSEQFERDVFAELDDVERAAVTKLLKE
ncbi:HIT domain-containing protein [Candidatus Saccharibacteria bacterium]|nr:HIT domain-containing protein [Candidatus Saccharibacteria bacterium]